VKNQLAWHKDLAQLQKILLTASTVQEAGEIKKVLLGLP
jgi:hypothetical protein